MFLAVASAEHADAFVARMDPLLESHHRLSMVSEAMVVRGPRFDRAASGRAAAKTLHSPAGRQ